MSNESPLNVREDALDTQSETQEHDPISPKPTQHQAAPGSLATKPTDGFPPSPLSHINVSPKTDAKKGKGRKRKGKKGKAGRKAGKPQAVLPIPDQAAEDKPLSASDPSRQPQAGEAGVRATGPDQIGLHPVTNKNLDKKGMSSDGSDCGQIVEAQPIEGVEDVMNSDQIDEVQTRAEVYAKIKAVWEQAGDICVRVYARPLNPRLVLVEWEGEDGVEKHGKIVVGERQRGMFGPGKVVWVKGPLVGDRWLLAGKYNFLGNRVS